MLLSWNISNAVLYVVSAVANESKDNVLFLDITAKTLSFYFSLGNELKLGEHVTQKAFAKEKRSLPTFKNTKRSEEGHVCS